MGKIFDILVPLIFVGLILLTLSMTFMLPTAVAMRDDVCDDDWTRASGAHKACRKTAS